MAFDFPASPTIGQVFTTGAGISYVYNGYGWVQQGAAGSLYVAKAGDVMTGDLSISKNTADHARLALHANTAGGYRPLIAATMVGVSKWVMYLGDDFELQRYDNSSQPVDLPLSISRGNGAVNVAKTMVVGTQEASSALTVNRQGSVSGNISFSANGTARWYIGEGAGIGDTAFRLYNATTAQNAFAIAQTGQVNIPATIASTSPTTGALTVGGGVGISGTLNISGTFGPSTPIGTPQIDALGQTQTAVASGSSVAIAGSGGFIVFVANLHQGNNAIYIMDNAATNILVSGQGVWTAPTTTPAAGTCSVQWDGSANMRIYNNRGLTENFRAFVIKIR